MTTRQPTLYIPHGGGPWPFVDLNFGPLESWRALRSYLEGLYSFAKPGLKGILCVSAHFEAESATVTTAQAPPMLYDYGGFPAEAYTITWPAPGDPALATRVRQLLDHAGLSSGEDDKRGFDHGTFVPLKLADPDARLPTVQLSLIRGLDPELHITLGRALAPLRDEGILIVGSGSSFHNLRTMMSSRAKDASAKFDAWLAGALELPPAERTRALISWVDAPCARDCHPREEHLLPLHVCLGAAEQEPVSFPFCSLVLGAHMRAAHFG